MPPGSYSALLAASQTRLVAADSAAYDWFGYAVAISGDTAVVGAVLVDVSENVDQGLAYVFVRRGGVWTQVAQLTASDGEAYDCFGDRVAVSGNTIVMGDPWDKVGDNEVQGSAYVFVKPSSGWVTTSTYHAKLTESDGKAWDALGVFLAISGDTIVVGDCTWNGSQGSAYVFVKPIGGWATTSNYNAKLTASDGGPSDTFGFSVAISGNIIVVGAPWKTVGDNEFQGSAYVFVKPSGGWATTSTYAAKLTASDGKAGDVFSYSVAILGNTIVVGAIDDDVGDNIDQGLAYVFNLQGGMWRQSAKLTASDGAAYDEFGWSVPIFGNTIFVGAPHDDVGDNVDQGSAYVFGCNRNVCKQSSKVTAANGVAGDNFSWTIAVSGDSYIVGAPMADVGMNADEGSAYIVKR